MGNTSLPPKLFSVEPLDIAGRTNLRSQGVIAGEASHVSNLFADGVRFQASAPPWEHALPQTVYPPAHKMGLGNELPWTQTGTNANT